MLNFYHIRTSLCVPKYSCRTHINSNLFAQHSSSLIVPFLLLYDADPKLVENLEESFCWSWCLLETPFYSVFSWLPDGRNSDSLQEIKEPCYVQPRELKHTEPDTHEEIKISCHDCMTVGQSVLNKPLLKKPSWSEHPLLTRFLDET